MEASLAVSDRKVCGSGDGCRCSSGCCSFPECLDGLVRLTLLHTHQEAHAEAAASTFSLPRRHPQAFGSKDVQPSSKVEGLKRFQVEF